MWHFTSLGISGNQPKFRMDTSPWHSGWNSMTSKISDGWIWTLDGQFKKNSPSSSRYTNSTNSSAVCSFKRSTLEFSFATERSAVFSHAFQGTSASSHGDKTSRFGLSTRIRKLNEELEQRNFQRFECWRAVCFDWIFSLLFCLKLRKLTHFFF